MLSGPSGVGKDAVLSYLKASSPNFKFVCTNTTRPRRANEKDNVDYHFVSQAEFQNLLSHNELLESAKVYENWYGVPKEPIRQALQQGNDIMVKVDVQGAATIKKLVPQAVFIFLAPPSFDELGFPPQAALHGNARIVSHAVAGQRKRNETDSRVRLCGRQSA